jgi:dihydroorotase
MELRPRPTLPEAGTTRPASQRNCARADLLRAAVSRRHGQKGAVHLKAVVWTMILAAFVYVMAVTVPVLINEFQFQDSLDQIARFASVNHRSADLIQKAVLEEAQKEELPVDAENVKVTGTGGNVHINVEYSVVIDLKVYQWTLDFHPTANNAAFL